MGNKAIYVGKKNLGYDVESKMPNGKMRYIEVKLIPSETSEFTMTNNEYTAAHQYGEDFYMCIVIQRNDGIKVTYVKDPLNNIQVEKRVRQWEWVCDSFSGEEYIFRYED